jgi:hypothetical protein
MTGASCAATGSEKVTDRRGRDKRKAAWSEKLADMQSLGIEYRPGWAQDAT